MEKASIYRGFRSTRTQGGLWENPNLNQLEIASLEIGFDRDQNFLKQRTRLDWGSGSGSLTKGLGGLTAMAPCGKPMDRLGRAWGGDSSSPLGRTQGRARIRPKAKRKGKNLFRFFKSLLKNYKPMEL
jgi:hypothetical protein